MPPGRPSDPPRVSGVNKADVTFRGQGTDLLFTVRRAKMGTRHQDQGPLARRLQSLRQRARLNQEGLAWLSGVSVHLIQSLEQGRASNPTLRTMLRLAEALGVTVAELLEGVAPGPEDDP
jgi:DNA-binding XRE family transcriptional regulator